VPQLEVTVRWNGAAQPQAKKLLATAITTVNALNQTAT
jgi:hypothetical protein